MNICCPIPAPSNPQQYGYATGNLKTFVKQSPRITAISNKTGYDRFTVFFTAFICLIPNKVIISDIYMSANVTSM
jgi:hypothetical protein